MKLSIHTLGEFDIKSNDKSILSQSSRTYKLYRLFEYFLTFRNKKLLPETIIDNLMSDNESDDPKNILRTQIFRLRKTIKALLPDNVHESDYFSINFANGYYFLEIGENAVIDVSEFEMFIKQADMEYEHNIELAGELYSKALSLYKGLYLSDNNYEVWLIPTRNYYQRLYLKTLYRLISILKQLGEHENIISLCEESLLIEPAEENIHICLMEAMLDAGKIKSALNYYDYSQNLLAKEFSSKPSSEFTHMLGKIQNYSPISETTDLDSIYSNFKNDDLFGSIQCTNESFKFLFNLQKRKSLREDVNDYICIINIINKSKTTKGLSELLKYSLRKGDVFTFRNRHQVLIMLHNMDCGGSDTVESRIYGNLPKYTSIVREDLGITFQHLDSLTNIK